jgi:hypothetical protein
MMAPTSPRSRGIELPKNKTTYGPAFDKLLRAHAEKLDAKGRVRFMLQLATGAKALDKWGPDALLKPQLRSSANRSRR